MNAWCYGDGVHIARCTLHSLLCLSLHLSQGAPSLPIQIMLIWQSSVVWGHLHVPLSVQGMPHYCTSHADPYSSSRAQTGKVLVPGESNAHVYTPEIGSEERYARERERARERDLVLSRSILVRFQQSAYNL